MPRYAEAHNKLGNTLGKQGHPVEAIGRFRLALRFKNDLAEAHNNLANAIGAEGRFKEAIGHYRLAL